MIEWIKGQSLSRILTGIVAKIAISGAIVYILRNNTYSWLMVLAWFWVIYIALSFLDIQVKNFILGRMILFPLVWMPSFAFVLNIDRIFAFNIMLGAVLTLALIAVALAWDMYRIAKLRMNA